MKNQIKKSTLTGAVTLLVLFSVNTGCNKNDVITPTASSTSDQTFLDLRSADTSNFTEINLVSDVEEYSPAFIDANLVNAWGLAFSDEGEAWVSSADMGLATIYDANGVTLDDPVAIPFDGDPMGGAPTGAIYNPTTSFVIPAAGEPAEFIYSTENGTIVAAAGGVAYTVADRSSFDANYKGLTMAKEDGEDYLYAADFHNATINVYNSSFEYEDDYTFTDPDMPAGYAPFNIRAFGDKLIVAYAKQLAPENDDDEAGPGNGIVDIYNTDGSFVKRFTTGGTLNSPWGIEKVLSPTPAILIGNFGDGKINVFDMDGNYTMTLQHDGEPIVIEGLWSIVFPRTNLPVGERNRLYFTSGPDEETHGVFGYITPQIVD